MALATYQRRIGRSTSHVITVEHAAYLGLAVLSIVLHLWALGARALHHDETIHAYYSWLLYRGEGYVHDPLTHGPFLYYWTALQYALFGDSDFTARLSAALFGITLTLLPWLLRREIGRWAALIAAAYLVISPVTLYVGRFIRHDVFAVTWELLCLIAFLRYIATRRARWLYIFGAALALMYCTIETSYLFTLTFGSFVVLAALWQVNRRLLGALGVFALLAGATLTLLPGHSGTVVMQATNGYEPVLDSNGQPQTAAFPLVTEAQALVVRNQGDDRLLGQGGYLDVLRKTLFGDPANTIHKANNLTLQGQNGVLLHTNIVVLLVLTLLFLAVTGWLLWFRRADDGTTMWRRAVNRVGSRTLLPALDSLWSRHGALALLLAFVIYALLFTSFGMHSSGIVSGVTGSLLYWVAQHDVQRGGQPQHYYLVQLLVYEPLLLTIGIGSMLAGFVHLAVQIRRHAVLTARRIAPGLLAWWAGGSLALYTWAGEKMPWITLHLVVPLTIIGAWGAASLLRWAFQRAHTESVAQATRRGAGRTPLWMFVGIFVAVSVFGVLQLTRSVRITDQNPTGSPATPWIVLATLLIWLALLIGYAALQGPRRALGGLIIGLGLIWGMYSFRSAWRLNYQNGDVPVEMMVYVQSSPDVVRVVDELRRTSLAKTGRLDMPIMYDNETIWKWYVRNYREKTNFNGAMSGVPSDETQAILMIQDNWETNSANVAGFVEQRYPLRWWFPEQAFYRFTTMPLIDPQTGEIVRDADGQPKQQRGPFEQDSTIGRLVRRPWDARTLNELGRYLLFRQPPEGLSAVDFKIYVRPDIAYMFGLPASDVQSAPQLR